MVQPTYTTSGMEFFQRDHFEHAARQLDTNDLKEISDPDSLMGQWWIEYVTNNFDETYIGPPGEDGKTAYQLAVEDGFVGTEEEWIDSLEGTSAYEVAVAHGFVGTEAQWLASLQALSMLPMQCNGILSVKTYPTAVYVQRAGTYRVRATCRDRGTGADLIVNIHVNGVASSLSGADRPTIAAGSGLGSDAAGALVTLAQGDFITGVEVVQVGLAWGTLVVQLFEEV